MTIPKAIFRLACGQSQPHNCSQLASMVADVHQRLPSERGSPARRGLARPRPCYALRLGARASCRF